MKARITTVLSLTGVLVAGSAAALVNTQVLQSTTAKSTTASEFTVAESQPESVSTVATTPVSNPGDLPNKLEGLAPVAVTAAATPVSTQQSYAIGEAGTVVLDTANGGLAVVAITPNSGWGVLEHKNTDPLSIEVKFQSATTLVEFKANVLFGIVAWDTESQLLTPPSTDGTTAKTSGNTAPSTAGTTGGTTGGSTAKPQTTVTIDDGASGKDAQHSDDQQKSDDSHHGGSNDDD